MNETMLLLAVDSSTPCGSVALCDQSSIIGHLSVNVQTTHSEGLMPAIDALFQRTQRAPIDLTALAVVTGPGSYTGLRIGITTVQGFAFPNKLPCVGMSSMDVLAHAFPHSNCILCPVLPARKGWLYARLYTWTNNRPEPISEELYVTADDLVSLIDGPTLFYGPGLNPHREVLQGMLEDDYVAVDPVYDQPRADLLAVCAASKIQAEEGIPAENLRAQYFGPSQAEINWKKHHPKSKT